MVKKALATVPSFALAAFADAAPAAHGCELGSCDHWGPGTCAPQRHPSTVLQNLYYLNSPWGAQSGT